MKISLTGGVTPDTPFDYSEIIASGRRLLKSFEHAGESIQMTTKAFASILDLTLGTTGKPEPKPQELCAWEDDGGPCNPGYDEWDGVWNHILEDTQEEHDRWSNVHADLGEKLRAAEDDAFIYGDAGVAPFERVKEGAFTHSFRSDIDPGRVVDDAGNYIGRITSVEIDAEQGQPVRMLGNVEFFDISVTSKPLPGMEFVVLDECDEPDSLHPDERELCDD